MQKMSKIFLVLTTAICGLFGGCYDGEMECYDSNRFVSLNFLTTDEFDSIQLYLNEKHICYGDVGVYYEQIICQDTGRFLVATVVSEADVDKCVLSEENPIWYGFHCFVGKPSDGIDVNSAKIRAQIFYKDEKSWIETPLNTWGGNYVNVIAESDTTRWFTYDKNPVRPYFDDYDSPSSSNRVGCYDGYCVATLPMADKDVCYDK